MRAIQLSGVNSEKNEVSTHFVERMDEVVFH